MQNLTGLVLYRLEKARKGEDVGGSYIRKYKTKGGNTRYIYARDLKGSGGKVSDLGQIKVSKTYKTPGTIFIHNDKRYELGKKQSSGKYKMVEVDNTGKRIGTEFAVSDKTLDRMTRSQVHLTSPGKEVREAEIEARMPKPEPVNTTSKKEISTPETMRLNLDGFNEDKPLKFRRPNKASTGTASKDHMSDILDATRRIFDDNWTEDTEDRKELVLEALGEKMEKYSQIQYGLKKDGSDYTPEEREHARTMFDAFEKMHKDIEENDALMDYIPRKVLDKTKKDLEAWNKMVASMKKDQSQRQDEKKNEEVQEQIEEKAKKRGKEKGPAAKAKDALVGLSRFASKDDTRYNLTGVHVSSKDGQTYMTSTNGHVIMRVKLDVDLTLPDEDVILNVKDLKDAFKGGDASGFGVSVQGDDVKVNNKKVERIEGRFPNTEEFFDGTHKGALKLNNLDVPTIKKWLKEAPKASASDRRVGRDMVVMKLTDGQLELYQPKVSTRKLTLPMPGVGNGKTNMTAVDFGYLTNTMASLKGETTLHMSEKSHELLTFESGNTQIAVMPRRV